MSEMSNGVLLSVVSLLESNGYRVKKAEEEYFMDTRFFANDVAGNYYRETGDILLRISPKEPGEEE